VVATSDAKSVRTRSEVKPWRDAETLRWAYTANERSSVQAAKTLGVSRSTVTNWMEKHGIDRRERGPAHAGPWRDESTLREEYIEKGHSISELAKRWDASTATISRWLDEHDVQHRHSSPGGENHPQWKDGRSLDEGPGLRECLDSRECVYCGATYDPCDRRQEYCSPECASKSLQRRVSVVCETCGSEFKVVKSREDTAKYCSEDCIEKRVTLTCDWCESDFEVRPSRSHKRFCGQECATEWQKVRFSGESNPNWVGGEVETQCQWCDSIVHREQWYLERVDRVFCSTDCRAEWQSENRSGENHPRYSGGHFPYGPGFNENKKQQVRRRDQYRCQDCGMTQPEHLTEQDEALHVHHVTPAREFDDPQERNAMENLITLCCHCHLGKWENIPGLCPQ